MPIAVHRWGVVDVKKRYIFSTRKRSLRPDSIYSYTAFPFNPFSPPFAKSQNHLLTTFLCRQKYIFIFVVMKTDKTIIDRRTNKLFNIRKIIKHNQCCLICLRRINGTIKKYKTYC